MFVCAEKRQLLEIGLCTLPTECFASFLAALMEIYHFESNAMTKLMVQSPRTSVVSDDEELKKLGYEQVLYRGLGAFSNFAFGFTEVALLVSFTSQYGFGLRTGGSTCKIMLL